VLEAQPRSFRLLASLVSSSLLFFSLGVSQPPPARAVTAAPTIPDPTDPADGCEWLGEMSWLRTNDSSNEQNAWSNHTRQSMRFATAPIDDARACSSNWMATYDINFVDTDPAQCPAASPGEVQTFREQWELQGTGTGYAAVSILENSTPGEYYPSMAGYSDGPFSGTITREYVGPCAVEGTTVTQYSEQWSLNAGCWGTPTTATGFFLSTPTVQAVVGSCSYVFDDTNTSGTVTHAVETYEFRFRRVACDTNIDTDADSLSDCAEYEYSTNPFDPDSDDDGITDGAEVGNGTDPLDSDSDADGLSDGEEAGLGTNPLDADSDHDGYDDLVEVEAKTDPLDANSFPGQPPDGDGTDSDQDGFPDAWEDFFGTDPNDPRDPASDLFSGGKPLGGVAGATCGTANYAWYTSTGDLIGGGPGEQGCVMVLSGAIANALLDAVLESDLGMSEAVTALVGVALGDNFRTPPNAYTTVLDMATKWGAKSGLLRALGLVKYNTIFTIGEAIGVAGATTVGLFILNEMRNHNACIQVTVAANGDGVNVAWNLLFADGRSKIRADSVAGTREKIDRFLSSDTYPKHTTNLRCAADGSVIRQGGPGAVFDDDLALYSGVY
jgi:Bacterial TSP3 repeat